MLEVWETIVSSGANVSVTWADICRARAARPERPAATAARLLAARDMPYIDTGENLYTSVFYISKYKLCCVMSSFVLPSVFKMSLEFC